MGQAVKNELLLEKLATFGKMGHTVKNRSHCNKKQTSSQGMMLFMP